MQEKVRRQTKQRQFVLEAVRSRYDHPSAEQIYLDVRTIDERVSRGTVYRNLSCLCDTGEIKRIQVPGADRYDLRVDMHYHLLCVCCGTVCDAPFAYRAICDREVSKRSGYLILRHGGLFEGICPACRAQKEKQTNEQL